MFRLCYHLRQHSLEKNAPSSKMGGFMIKMGDPNRTEILERELDAINRRFASVLVEKIGFGKNQIRLSRHDYRLSKRKLEIENILDQTRNKNTQEVNEEEFIE